MTMTATSMMNVRTRESLRMLTHIQCRAFGLFPIYSNRLTLPPHSIPEDSLPTYKAPAPALILKSGTVKT